MAEWLRDLIRSVAAGPGVPDRRTGPGCRDALRHVDAPAKDYYLYRERITFGIKAPPAIGIASVSLPKGEAKADPTFGTVHVFHRPFEVVIGLKPPDARAKELELRATYQGCNEPLGVCYPPIEKVMSVSLPAPRRAAAR